MSSDNVSENQRIFTEEIAKSVVALNNPEGTLPYGFYHPQFMEKMVWRCSHTADGKEIVSVVEYIDETGEKHRKIDMIDSEESALDLRNDFIIQGWRPIDMPKLDFKGFDDLSKNSQTRLIHEAQKFTKLTKQ